MTAPDPASQFTGNIKVPFDRVATFVRQVTHDVRNGLNAMDLQAAYVLELARGTELSDEIEQVRSQIKQSARALKSLSENFWLPQPSLIAYQAKIFIEDFCDRLAKTHPEKAPQVVWSAELGEENIEVDIELAFAAFMEVFKNAFQFSDAGEPISARASVGGGSFVLDVGERLKTLPSPPEQWGEEPFISTRRSGYGLGLFRTRMILAAHRGEIQFSYDSGKGELTTRVTLPLSP